MSDTIAAIATARRAGGIAIIRVSGPEAERVLKQAFVPARASAFESHRLMYGRAVDADGKTIDEVMAVLMRAPRTYTYEDVAEIQCHGGSVTADRVLRRAIECGARMAEPGEFTKRAFLNGRIDLSEAEAVMQLIGANSEAAARASVRQLEGGVSGFVRGISERLTSLMALIEASTDYPDEVEEEAAAGEVMAALQGIIREIDANCDERGARILREGASIVLAGRPNVGKSSLMNALLNQERAIVTEIPGTTRDVLTERISIGGVLAELSDTAGRRHTVDPVEKIGVERARRAVDGADIVLIVLDSSQRLNEEDEELLRGADARCIVCLNKTDLEGVTGREAIEARCPGAEVLEISAEKGQGVETLVEALERRLNVDAEAEGRFTMERHIALARQAREHLERACEAIETGMPLDAVAIDLREALTALSEIVGFNPTEQVISSIFANFCVGK